METLDKTPKLDRMHSHPLLFLLGGLGKIVTFQAMLPEVLEIRTDMHKPLPDGEHMHTAPVATEAVLA